MLNICEVVGEATGFYKETPQEIGSHAPLEQDLVLFITLFSETGMMLDIQSSVFSKPK